MVKSWILCLMVRTRQRMSIVTSPIRHHTESPSQCNRTRKINKRHTVYKGRNKNFLFADDIIVYIEKSRNLQKLVELKRDFRKVIGYNVNRNNINHVSIC